MALSPRRRWNIGAIVAVLLALALVLIGLAQIDMSQVRSRDGLRLSSSSRALNTNPALLPASGWTPQRGGGLSDAEIRVDQADREAAPYIVQVGVYATSTYDLDLRVPSYSGNGYIWLRWEEPLQRYLQERNVTMSERFNLLNGLLSDQLPVITPVGGGAQLQADGSYYQLFTFVGRFYIDRDSFRHYPFMNVSLPVVLEANDVDGELDYRQLRLQPDIRNSGMGLYSNISGWLNGGWSIAEYRHHYATNFGLGGGENDYSQVVFEISFGTSSWSVVWRLILPLVVLMAMVLLVFKVRSDEQDARASIPVTVLLTLVFLQQGYRDELPSLPFLTFLDSVYVVAYGVTLTAFVLVLWIGRRYAVMEDMAEGPAREALQRRLHWLDDIWPVLVVLVGICSLTACWMAIPPGT
ncbi:hypothetical protein [Cyanobium sp. Morenito 9A2]|uniref:hypothetical protein n=1 Tax=Cyanobium sp. Morenito 9A2 TaxID=2823718 RepID=UPI0020CC60CE|nr:hypothetical protein [Cyanobium sp. Morenito 9A2]MCP9849959.1 hypothetical protein [Cyanobium sp. Morenito 9A2]